jgi:hypothetical protein
MNVFLADSSVDAPPTEHPRFHFTKNHLAASNAGQGSISLDSWVNESMPRRSDDLLLQMDIEGDEFEVLLSASEDLLSRFRIMAIEFHGLESLWNEPFFHLASAVFDKILQSHRCIHLHPNNCAQSTELGGLCVPDVIEFTFLRRDRITDDSYRTEFPHPLDSDNSARDHLALPSCWYAAASR